MVSKETKDLIDIFLVLTFGLLALSFFMFGDYYYMDNAFEGTLTVVIDLPSRFRTEQTKSLKGVAGGTPFEDTMDNMSACLVNICSLTLELFAAVPTSLLRDFTVLFKEYAFGTDVCYLNLN